MLGLLGLLIWSIVVIGFDCVMFVCGLCGGLVCLLIDLELVFTCFCFGLFELLMLVVLFVFGLVVGRCVCVCGCWFDLVLA